MNIYDIAEKAGVSIATVSRVLNSPSTVRDKTRIKVQNVIDAYGYRPSDVARGLASNKTNAVGIMVPDIRNAFHANSAFLLEQKLLSKGYSSILCNTSDESSQKLKYFELLNQKGVEGIIFVGASYGDRNLEKMFEELNKKIAIVVINNYIGENSTFVICDEKKGLDKSIGYLKNKGYKRPLYVQDKRKYLTRACISKKEGFEEALKKYYPNIDIKKSILNLEEDISEYTKIIDYLKTNKDIDAIQFEKDTSAIKFMKTAQNYGLDIPSQLGIVGFDNIEMTNYTSKSISTIDHRIEEHCTIAINLLFDKLSGKEVQKENYVEPFFVEKETT